MTLLPTSAPPLATEELCGWTLDGFHDLRVLRAALRHYLPAGEACERLIIVATELATNALRHGRPPTVVRLLRAGDRLILDVADRDLGSEPQVDRDRPFGAGGLGLQLAQTFAADVGWYRSDATKHVWASFPS